MANSYLQISSFWKRWTDRFGASLKSCSLFGGHGCLLPWLLFWPIPILKLKIVGTASFLRSSLRGLKAETNELLAERFCLKLSFVKWSVLRVNVLVVWNVSHNNKFSSFEKTNILILYLKLLLQFVAAQNTMGFRQNLAMNELQNCFAIFPQFSNSPTVTSRVFFPTISR